MSRYVTCSSGCFLEQLRQERQLGATCAWRSNVFSDQQVRVCNLFLWPARQLSSCVVLAQKVKVSPRDLLSRLVAQESRLRSRTLNRVHLLLRKVYWVLWTLNWVDLLLRKVYWVDLLLGKVDWELGTLNRVHLLLRKFYWVLWTLDWVDLLLRKVYWVIRPLIE